MYRDWGGGKRNAFMLLVGKPEVSDHQEDKNVGRQITLREIGWGGVDWIVRAQDRCRWRALVNAVLNFWVP
jgi:hypothetical protein